MARTYTGNLSNFSEPGELIQVMNTKLNNALGVTFVVALFISLWIMFGYRTGSPKQALAGASFVALVVSYLLWLVSLVAIHVVIVFTAITIGGTIWLYKGKD